MNNILKHSRCKHVILEFSIANDRLYIKLSDDGKGVDLSQPILQNGSGYGLENMKRRAEKLHAKLAIVSNTGEGMSIRFDGEIPGNGY